MPEKTVVVIGAGLAGLSAALLLADEGFRVTVLERKPFPGGRATSYLVPQEERKSPEGPEYVDNCQHVLLKCCTNLIDFYSRLGVLSHIRFYDSFLFIDPTGKRAALQPSSLPPPFHFMPAFLRFTPLTLRDKFGIVRGFWAILRERRSAAELDSITIRQWLDDQRQTPVAFESFWRPVLVSALNEELEKASALCGLQVFREAFLKHRAGHQIGIPTVPLSQLYTDPSKSILQKNRGELRTGSRVDSFQVEGGLVDHLTLADGSPITADYYVCSTPPEALAEILPKDHNLIDKNEYFSKTSKLASSPIISVYFWFDRDITPLQHAVLLGGEMQWLFNKGRGHIGMVASAARKLLKLSRTAIIDVALRELRERFPEVRDVSLLRTVVIKEPLATISCEPGVDSLRPQQQTPLSNLYLAGDWTQTGWPPTMESAVRSGYRCAELILEKEGFKRNFLKPELESQWPASWFFSRKV